MTQDAFLGVTENERQSNHLVRMLAFDNPDDFEVIEIGTSVIDGATLVAGKVQTPQGEAIFDFLKPRIVWSVLNIEIGGERKTKLTRHRNHSLNTIPLLRTDANYWNNITFN